jgi:hypothetical protein
MTNIDTRSGTAVMRVSGVYLNAQQAEAAVRELKLAGFEPSVSTTGSAMKAVAEEATPLDRMGLPSTLEGTLPSPAREGVQAPASWVEGETSVSIPCQGASDAERAGSILRGTGARNIQNP